MCDFIEGKLKELVLLLQQHKHSSYCKRHNTCRFNFPKPPSCKTLITQSDVEPNVASKAQSVLVKVYKVLADGHTDLRLEEVLAQAQVTPSDYMEALEVSSSGNVVLKREPNECFIRESVDSLCRDGPDMQYM